MPNEFPSSDRIHIEQLEVSTHIGVPDEERGAPQRFKVLQLADFAHHVSIARHRVMVGERNNIQTAHFCPFQNIQVARFRLLVIGRTARVQMQIYAEPLHLGSF